MLQSPSRFCLSIVLVSLLCSAAQSRGAEPPADESKPVVQANTEAENVQPAPEPEKEQSDEAAERKKLKKEVIPPDVSPEKATHDEIEPLAVEFKKLTAMRFHQDGRLLACDSETKQVKAIASTSWTTRTTGFAS